MQQFPKMKATVERSSVSYDSSLCQIYMKTEADKSACCKIYVTLEIQGDSLQLNMSA